MEARDQVVSFRSETPAARIARLNREIEEATQLARSGIRVALSQARVACAEAKDFPLSPGEREELRQLTERLEEGMVRLEALDGRR